MLHLVTGEGGTAPKAQTMGYSVGGKTGTAQAVGLKEKEKYNAAKMEEHQRDHSLYTAFAPLEAPTIALAVIVENAGFGAAAAAPVIAWDNIAFPDFLLRTTGEDYSREDSVGYVIGERRACLRLRLRPRDAGELWSAAQAGIFAKARWDLAQPADAAEWDGKPGKLAELKR